MVQMRNNQITDTKVTAIVIADRRKRLRISQDELAVRVGCTRDVISRIENGKMDPPFQMMKRIASHLGLTMEMLSPLDFEAERDRERAGRTIDSLFRLNEKSREVVRIIIDALVQVQK